jgi:hypothetical protein
VRSHGLPAFLVGVTILLGSPAGARATDLETLMAAHWGMDAAGLDKALDSADQPLPGRWDFGRYYADRIVENVDVGGHAFRAFLQMDRGTDRLGQILLERRGRQAGPLVFEDIKQALTERFGEPEEDARQGDKALPTAIRVVWRMPELTVTASFFDFYTTGMFFEDPNSDRDPLTPYAERRRNNPRFLPRRALIRFNPP